MEEDVVRWLGGGGQGKRWEINSDWHSGIEHTGAQGSGEGGWRRAGGDARARVESDSGEGLRTQYHTIHTYFVTYSHNSGNKHISPQSTDGERIESRRGRRDRGGGGGGLILHGKGMTSACKSAKV